MTHILFMGYRKEPVQLAKSLGYEVSVWSPIKPLYLSQKYVDAVLIHPFCEKLTFEKPVLAFIKNLPPIDAIIALTENALVPTALLRKKLFGIDEVDTAIACHDKFIMKKTAELHDIPVTPYALLNAKTDIDHLVQTWGLPFYAKLRGSSGSRGLYKIFSPTELKKLIDKNYLLEKEIVGEEFSIELFVYDGKIEFINFTEYHTHHSVNILPKPFSYYMKRKLKSFVKKIVDAYQINDGMVHIECFVSQKTILLGELTIRPPGGYLMNLIEAVYGFDPWRALLDVSLGNKPHCPQKNRCVAAVYIAHPGEGTIDSIEGYEKIMQLPEFYFGKIKKMAGDIVRKREGSGQDIGYILFVAKNYLAIAKVIEKAKKLLAITLKSSS